MNPPSENPLLRRVRNELQSLFDPSAPATLSTAPACIDAIGGALAEHGGVMVVLPIDQRVTVLTQARTDQQVCVFDFNEYDEQRPFTLQISVEALLGASADQLKRNLAEPGRRFAAPVLASILSLHRHELLDLRGVNLAVLRDPGSPAPHCGSTSLATAQALSRSTDRDAVLAACRDASLFAEASPATTLELRAMREGKALVRDHGEVRPVDLPEGVQLAVQRVGDIDFSGLTARLNGGARMAHRLVLAKMRAFGAEAGRELISDPMDGQIGNLAMSDYKRFFRGALPEAVSGAAFLSSHGSVEGIDPEADYSPQLVADHLVIESHRAREWVRYVQEARVETDAAKRLLALDKAGHLMYASHKSARENCALGSDEADEVVARVRVEEASGLYGARFCTRGAFVVMLGAQRRNWASMTSTGPELSFACESGATIRQFAHL